MAAMKRARKPAGDGRRRSVLVPVILAALVAGLAVIGLHYAREPKASLLEDIAAWDPTWPSMPAKGHPARSLKTTRDAYAFVARRPDIAEYLPCYCGCEREGHKSLRDCFVDRYGPDGKPVWDGMGYT